MTNENLAEEGKRLEVALKYVSQINQELKNEMKSYDGKMSEYEDLIEENQSLKLLMVPNSQSIEKMNETLKRDYAKLKAELKLKQAELTKMKQDALYCVFNEKAVASAHQIEVKEHQRECARLKRTLEEARSQANKETGEQERERVRAGIEKKKAKIQALKVATAEPGREQRPRRQARASQPLQAGPLQGAARGDQEARRREEAVRRKSARHLRAQQRSRGGAPKLQAPGRAGGRGSRAAAGPGRGAGAAPGRALLRVQQVQVLP